MLKICQLHVLGSKMNANYWTANNISNYFDITRQGVHSAEERGDIPKAIRINRGKVSVRNWGIEAIPAIGEQFGFLKKPKKQVIFAVYTCKGGVLKTSISFNLARTLALNGIKTLIVGLEGNQYSITGLCLPQQEDEALMELENMPSLYHYFYEEAPLKDIIKKTELPTLDIIPETAELNSFGRKLLYERNREFLFKTKLIPHLSEYDVIIFDNGANLNLIAENSLTCADVLISPLGCESLAFKAVKTNFHEIFKFKEALGVEWKDLIVIPTLLANTAISQKFYASYVNSYPEYVTKIPIKQFNAISEEAMLMKKSVLEYKQNSELAEEYKLIIQEIWERANKEDI